MNILYSADDNFARILAVSISSLLNQHQNIAVNVFVLDNGISEENKDRIHSLFQIDKHSLYLIKSEEIVDIVADRGSVAQFSRLFFNEYLPEFVDRILYLDCDTLIVNSLQSFYLMDMKEKMIILAKDPFSKRYREFLNIPRKADMFNSGVMLIDRNEWNRFEITKKIEKTISLYNGKIIQGDQGIIDIISQEKYGILSPRYNVISSYYEFSYNQIEIYRKPVNFYTESQIEDAIENPSIVHFTSDFLNNRPWLAGSVHPYKNQWQSLEMKIFKNNSEWQAKNNAKKIFNYLPEIIAIRVFGILQAYIRPLIFKLKGY
ncbi:glycosyltransferase family 8 protein [Latilactobacillus curvatus]|uniref:glycosyltransferase family 8 protein n=1 Tax=Latilactobacillus curvatus TaxID=28038 RepID=UPI0024109C1D|nr:glycosyltransferase family 8 protein [Latilactobacillus curvatus]MDG2982021.1 glycosyltransferase family 8 protein [Latilactobacillus curvatus]